MSKKYTPASTDRLAEEARQWDEGRLHPGDWQDAPEATPMAKASTAVSVRLPTPMLIILKEFARREGVGYQVLLKRWLDDRIRQERDKMAAH